MHNLLGDAQSYHYPVRAGRTNVLPSLTYRTEQRMHKVLDTYRDLCTMGADQRDPGGDAHLHSDAHISRAEPGC